jgi:ABC-type transport system involved in multi-copper enzyme maturation permease subunit
VLAAFTFREALRRRLVLAALALTAVFLGLFAVGTHFAIRELETSRLLLPSFRPVIISQLLLTGVWVMSLASALLAVFAAAGTLSGEIENFTIQAVASKPIRRWEIVVGKWLGFGVMVVVYTVVTATLVILIVRVQAGYMPPYPGVALAAFAIQSLVLLSMTILGSAFFPSLANGIGVFMLHAIAMAGGLEEQLGFVLRNETMQSIGVWISLVVPTDVMAKLAASGLQTSIGASTSMPGPFNVLSPPSAWMVLYAVLYLGACLAVAVLRFETRDL